MVLGVTGGIASGKSLVARQLVECGAAMVSADELSREAVAPGSPTLARLVEAFGAEILLADGSLDRQRLGALVFADAAARDRLNAITHPAIARLAATRLAQLQRQGVPLVVYEAPLLFEADAVSRVDTVLVVMVTPEVQLARLMARDGIERPAALERVAAQWPQADKLARADFVVDNSGSAEVTRQRVANLYRYLSAIP